MSYTNRKVIVAIITICAILVVLKLCKYSVEVYREYKEAFNNAPVVEAIVTDKYRTESDTTIYNKVGNVNVPMYVDSTNYYVQVKYNDKTYEVEISSKQYENTKISDKMQLKYFEDKMYVE
jgi:hypothetical protein